MGKGTRINVLEYCLDRFYIDLNFYKVFQIKKRPTQMHLKGQIRILNNITFPTSCTISDKSSSSCKISLIYNGLCNIA